MYNMAYEYEPYLGQDDKDIPCFRIYSDCEPIAETNENQPVEVQEKAARLLVASYDLVEGLRQAVYALKSHESFELGAGDTSHALADKLNRLLLSI